MSSVVTLHASLASAIHRPKSFAFSGVIKSSKFGVFPILHLFDVRYNHSIAFGILAGAAWM